MKPFTVLFLILLVSCGTTKPILPKKKIVVKCPYPQETHIKYTTAYLDEANVKERITWYISGKDSSRISMDRYDGKGHKTEAFEYYEGSRKLRKFIKSEWRDINTTTHFSFKYDSQGRQIEQYNHDFNPKQWNQMYEYDQYGNLVRWQTGRTFQLSNRKFCEYDSLDHIIYEYDCWDVDSCNPPDKYIRPYYINHIKYNEKGLMVENLHNYMDAMAGYLYDYEWNESGQITGITKTRVWSYFELDHEIPTINDINATKVYTAWKFEYDANGRLSKEIRTEKWADYDDVYEFIYNERGLIIQENHNIESTIYTYNEQGLVIEECQYTDLENKKLYQKLHFQYIYE